jgi:diguanylate cyclase
MPFRTKTVRNGVYVELVRSLYTTLIPTAIMSAGYVLSFSALAFEVDDPVLAAFTLAGVLSGAVRIAVLINGISDATTPQLDLRRARLLERLFAISYYQFAGLLGASAAYVLMLEPARFHMLVICLLVGYGAGVAAGVGLRPWIAIPSMLAAIVPAIAAIALHRDAIYWVTDAMITALLIGGSQSVIRRWRVTSIGIAKRLTYEALARHDVLTMLPNRLALREWFDSHIAIGPQHQLLAVHCLDLDGFKPVNDAYGHPVGDALLKAVALRLMRTIRPGDIAARLGGDEFAIIQRDLHNPEQAAALAQRLRLAIAEPIKIEGRDICVSTSVGYALCPRESPDLEELLGLGDQALYIAKNTGAGVECNDILMKTDCRVAA